MDTQLARALVRCEFYNRLAVSGGDGETRYRYDHVDISSYQDTLRNMWLAHPPQIGDLVHLPDGYRVINRSWMYSHRGSKNWPVGEPMPIVSPTLTLIVEREDGPFVDELESDPEDEPQ